VCGCLVAAIISLWGFVTLDGEDYSRAWDVAEGIDDIRQTNVDEVVMRLSAPDIWNRAVRGQMNNMLIYEINDARLRNSTQEMQMWQQLREVIRDPQRYQNGGIRIEPSENGLSKLQVREPAGQRFRGSPGWVLNAADKQQFAELTSILWQFPASRDHIASADYLVTVGMADGSGLRVNERDRVLVNEAVLALPSEVRAWVHRAARGNAEINSLTHSFWYEISQFCCSRIWRGDGTDGNPRPRDRLGFLDDDPRQSDLITGSYPYYVGYAGVFPAYGPDGPAEQPPGTSLVEGPQ